MLESAREEAQEMRPWRHLTQVARARKNLAIAIWKDRDAQRYTESQGVRELRIYSAGVSAGFALADLIEARHAVYMAKHGFEVRHG